MTYKKNNQFLKSAWVKNEKMNGALMESIIELKMHVKIGTRRLREKLTKNI